MIRAWEEAAARAGLQRVRGPSGVAVGDLTLHSGGVVRGDGFIARRGEKADGHAYVTEAIARGAAALVVQDAGAVPEAFAGPVWAGALHEGQLSTFASLAYEEPTRHVRVLGVTGTNGKTSCVWLLHALAEAAGLAVASIGTLGIRWKGHSLPGHNTTPDAVSLQRQVARLRAQGADAIAMEVSSHALALGRVQDVAFDVVGFTGLSRDHLDFHGTMEAYEAAKSRFFVDCVERSRQLGKEPVAVVWVDDPAGERMAQRAWAPVLRVGSQPDLSLHWRWERSGTTLAGQSMTLVSAERAFTLETPGLGGWWMCNAAVALAMVDALHLTGASVLVDALGGAGDPPGRMERVLGSPERRGPAVFVDYAHTPDALSKALRSLREAVGEGTLGVVVGCGGDRDRGKRPLMASATMEADSVIFCPDNPRGEEVQAIFEDMAAGVPPERCSDVAWVDGRREAIAAGVDCGVDALLVAGKGHESAQEVAGVRYPFDDRREVRRALRARSKGIAPSQAPWLWGWDAQRLASVVGAKDLVGSWPFGLTGVVIDSRQVQEGSLFVALRGSSTDGHAYVANASEAGAGVALVTRSCGAGALAEIVVDDPVEALARIGAALLGEARGRSRGTGVIALTGSVGKTTSKELLGALLEETSGRPVLRTPGNWNNDLGAPLTCALLAPEHAYAVLELGASREGDIERLSRWVAPDVGLVTAIAEAHLEGMGGSLAGVRATKAGLLQPGMRHAVIPHHELPLAPWRSRAEAFGIRLWSFGAEADADLRWSREDAAGPVRFTARSGEFDALLPLGLPGVHQAANAAGALLAASLLHAGPGGEAPRWPGEEAVRRAWSRVEIPGGRWRVQRLAGRTVIDDSYNANPASMRASIALLAQQQGRPRVAVLGAMRELGEEAAQLHAELGAFAAGMVEVVVAYGPEVEALAEGVRMGGKEPWVVAGPDDVAERLAPHLPPGAVVLFKGSRGVALERCVLALAACWPQEV